jgi:hypothetical protein
MLNMKFTRVQLTEQRSVLPGVPVTDEGMALVKVINGDVTCVKPSTGASGEIFAGVSLMRNTPPTLMPYVEEQLIPADGVIELPRTPLADQLLVKIAGNSATLVEVTPDAVSKVQVSGNTLTFHDDAVGKSVFIQFMYAPTIDEARTYLGDVPIGGLAGVAQSSTGVVTYGEICTNHFDASCDWSTALQVRLGPNGTFTTKGTGTLLTNVVIEQRPSSENAMLTLSIKL